MKRPLTEQQLRDELAAQLGFLKNSAERFDAGDESEARRLALAVRVLVHRGKSPPLLDHLQLLDCTPFWDSALSAPEPGQPYAGLAAVAVPFHGKSQRYVAMLDGTCTATVPFKAWWERVIFQFVDGRKVTRKDLITTVANQAGGAHVDSDVDESYAEIAYDNMLGWNPARLLGPEGKPASAADLVSVRQIAHEVLKTLQPDYVKRRPQNSVPEAVVMGLSHPGLGIKVARAGFSGVRRLDRCPCGSGIRYKDCHGKLS